MKYPHIPLPLPASFFKALFFVCFLGSSSNLCADVLFDDTFVGVGATRNEDAADPSDIQWWTVPTSTNFTATVPSTNDTVINTGLSMKGTDLNGSSANQQVVGKFSPITLGASVGASIELNCDVGNQAGTEISANRFVVGLYHDNGTAMTADATGNSADDKGYAIRIPFSSYASVTGDIVQEDGTNGVISSGTDVTTLASGAAFIYHTSGGARHLKLTLTRQSTGVQIDAVVTTTSGTIVSSASITDTTSPFTTFNEVMAATVSPGGTSLSFSLDNVQVETTSACFFSPYSFWNTSVVNEPAAADQSEVTKLYNQVISKPVQQRTSLNYYTLSVPVWVAPPGQSTIAVQDTDGYCNPLWLNVPWPSDAIPATGSDGHCVIWQPSTDQMWEFWKAAGTYPAITAQHGGYISGVNNGTGIFPNPFGARAVSMGLVGGLVTLDEVAEVAANPTTYTIPHCIAVAVEDAVIGHVNPATRDDGLGGTNAVTQGRRFKLPANYDPEISIPGSAPITKCIARAVRDYGLVIVDKSGVITMYAEDAKTGGVNPYNTTVLGTKHGYDVLDSFPWASLVQLNPTNVTNNNSASVVYSGTWTYASYSKDPGRINMDQHSSAITGNYAQLTVTSNFIQWVETKSNSRGIADVYIDGVLDSTIDLYNSIPQYQQIVFNKTWPSSGSHTIKIVVKGTKNAASSGYTVSIDGFRW